MKKTTLLIAVAALAGCASNDYKQMSVGSGLSEQALKANCEQITCVYDQLKDNVQATANDQNIMFALNGMESRTIEFTWVSNSNQIIAEVFNVTLYGTWNFSDSAEIYVGKEMVAKISGTKNSYVGTWNDVAQEHEKIETVRDVISVEQAEKIANANYEEITIRFYGKNGYKDVKPQRENNLGNVVNLVKAGV
ncbi:hypothetical protein [Vibrio sp. STUT-A11]|uniref:hypothetical protein n=1 Tax=Vibrio sp. STUT-A11 TaxID=2976236 RepID=UPI00222E6F19|nr:hypothetical protein [Vibrio sp. STUT-A11]BDR12940.1 hypothetical protein VspSTUT11_09160 [Vibrio sp. STUT-A11]